ncbi:3-dehydroshikimate dehydratase [BD1-7 clade bacterium]|nr:3-dehydroshikimate dehydratase [BD1-7 clade bacterium]
MDLSVCTISFRHQLISIDQIANWAKANHFQGIELWGAHARNLIETPQYDAEWLAGYGLRTTMISDYLPLQAESDILYSTVQNLARLAKHWGAKKIRTFAGGSGSSDTSETEFHDLVEKLQAICDWLAPHGINLVIETHPGTYADTVTASQKLIETVSRSNLQLNFDVLHIWESKADIITAVEQLAPHINHFHLKNISSVDHLNVFSPPNVYSASGTREGIVPLFEGAVDYRSFLAHVQASDHRHLANVDASLEWFGNRCKATLKKDRYEIQKTHQQYAHSM